MKLIIGLGNPGIKYVNTRHNVGFAVIDILAAEIGASSFSSKHNALLSEGKIGNEKVVLLKPQTYMNLSGQAVIAAALYYKIAPSEIIVIHDDLDLPLGRLRIKKGGGHGGHNGLKSIFQCLGTQDFLRVKIGIGRPPAQIEVADYVLSCFSKEDSALIAQTLVKAVEAIKVIVNENVDVAMNRFN